MKLVAYRHTSSVVCAQDLPLLAYICNVVYEVCTYLNTMCTYHIHVDVIDEPVFLYNPTYTYVVHRFGVNITNQEMFCFWMCTLPFLF